MSMCVCIYIYIYIYCVFLMIHILHRKYKSILCCYKYSLAAGAVSSVRELRTNLTFIYMCI